MCRKVVPLLTLLLALAGSLAGQMTVEQKLLDFQHLSAIYAKHYTPYEWKLEAFGFDLFDLAPWLERARRTKDDLDFYDLCHEYVASLMDAHSSFSLLSNFFASLPFHADIYDGIVLIDSITRSRLPAVQYPFEIGDELVSIDGKSIEELIRAYERYSGGANTRSRRRRSVLRILSRPQSVIARAHETPDESVVEIRRQSGAVESYTIAWQKSGKPLTFVGPVPTPKAAAFVAPEPPAGVPEYLRPIYPLLRDEALDPPEILNQGGINPVFAMPAGFRRRLSGTAADLFYSGTLEVDGTRLGFLRIPTFSPPSTVLALQQLETEIKFFEENTDGLIIDVMRNSGGGACYNEDVQRRLIPYVFRSMAREFRATWSWVLSFASSLELARQQRAEPWVIALLEDRLRTVEQAYRENRGRTGPLPLCSESIDRSPAAVVYTKPMMVLIDEFSISAADAFPAVLQDNGRALMVGMRTMGAGGSVGAIAAGIYSESSASVTLSMHHRKNPIVTPEYPAAPYVENIGVRPDIEVDYMTRDNLMRNGQPFADAILKLMVEHIRGER